MAAWRQQPFVFRDHYDSESHLGQGNGVKGIARVSKGLSVIHSTATIPLPLVASILDSLSQPEDSNRSCL
jgi:hypothetical protein